MCGLVAGWIHPNTVSEYLKKLQYRGSDSLGIGNFTYVFRTLSKTIKLSEMKQDENGGNFGDGPILGHSRWSSVGETSIKNTHPIQSAQNNILLVHNGTLTNYSDIRFELETILLKNYDNKTDTEVLTDYLGDLDNLQEPIVTWKSYVDNNFGGTYAIAFLLKRSPNLYWMTKDSPLYYYEGQVSSDPMIWPEYFFLPNNSWGWVKKTESGFELYVNGRLVEPEYSTNNSFSEKQEECADYMLKEIGEQCTLSYYYKNEIEEDYFNDATYVELIGCGTSYHAAILGEKYFELNKDYRVKASYSSEYTHKESWHWSKKIVLSQSGETSDSLEVLREWKKHHKKTILITNRPESTGTKLAKQTFLMNAGEEIAVAATKSFTSTVMMLLQLAQPKIYKDLDLTKFRENLTKVFNKHDEIRHLIPSIYNCKNYMVFGSGFNYPIAQETALKLQECAAINCQGLPAELWKHGYISICDENFLAIVYCPYKDEPKYERVLNAIKQTKARHGYVLGIGPLVVPECDWFIETPKDNLLLQPIINNMVGQLLAYSIGKYKGLNVDCPSNCSKAITVH